MSLAFAWCYNALNTGWDPWLSRRQDSKLRFGIADILKLPRSKYSNLIVLSLCDVKYSDTKFWSRLAKQQPLGNNISHLFVQTDVCYSDKIWMRWRQLTPASMGNKSLQNIYPWCWFCYKCWVQSWFLFIKSTVQLVSMTTCWGRCPSPRRSWWRRMPMTWAKLNNGNKKYMGLLWKYNVEYINIFDAQSWCWGGYWEGSWGYQAWQ